MPVFLVVVVYLFYLIIIAIFFWGGGELFCFVFVVAVMTQHSTSQVHCIMNKPIKLATSVNNFHNSLHCLF